MKTGSGKFSNPAKVNGCYGEVVLESNVHTNTSATTLRIHDVYDGWRAGILFGCQYFLDHCPKCNGLTVHILNIKSDAATDNTMMAYLTIQALVQSTGLPVQKEVYFDAVVGAFVFPR
ncbi:hypothetical protein GA0116948_102355 [Chitinophaga costaii]|uniref:Uncharacterized protein n=1 Tax=Chitinophaga costaii TaxID=1335309 RepID=A0A1C4AZE1_9BACT|nr:hypothetical protein [Chitinophaga costaii]PUZ26810.1 hypothetical protein DCM91_10465 [Chitinophaga costaii]SCB99934.1 hypothetical protein GA0116948_102355 [Chitinophaga costaii]